MKKIKKRIISAALSFAIALSLICCLPTAQAAAYSGSISLNDKYFSEQWALYNSGNFELRIEENDFPVYDNPFGQPTPPEKLPGGWSSSSSGSYISVLTAVSGVDINIRDAWSLYKPERETVIALIDTGVDTNHEDFGDVFWVNEDEIAGNGVDDDGNGYVDDVNGWDFYHNSSTIYYGDEDSHGTHGAGSIAASSGNGTGIAGIVSDGSVKIMVLKVLGGEDGSGKASSVAKAIRYAEANGASICNMSMGTENYDRSLYNAMADSDMLFVVSAGNDGIDIDDTACYPASFEIENVISVANLQPDGTLHSTSNYGAHGVYIAVPGSYILGLTADDTYSYMTGTSMSAPILSAAAAMLYSYCGGLTLAGVKDIILATAAPLSALDGLVVTGGMLDLGAAMKYVSANFEGLSQNSETLLPFADVSSDMAGYEAIAYLYNSGVMNGTGENTFSPSEGLTRAMTITVLGRIAGAEQADCDAFYDVQNGTWYSGYVGWAVAQGLVYGYGDGNFGTNDFVTAYQLDLILSRYAALLGTSYSSGLTGSDVLTRAQTAQALYDFCLFIGA